MPGSCVPIPETCPRLFDPVCGCDGITYVNDCERIRAQVQKDHDGPCGQVSCLDVATGKPYYQQARLPMPYNFKASPLAAAGRLYLASEEGDVIMLALGERFEVVGTNTLTDQSFIASPIVVGNDLYLRSRTHLFRIAAN